MKRRQLTRRRTTSYELLLYTLIFWLLSGVATFWFVNAETKVIGQDLGSEVGIQYLATAFPVISRSAGTELREANPESDFDDDEFGEGGQIQLENETAFGETGGTPSLVIDSASSGEPFVLIYHTHATESYQPVSEGNFHSVEEAGTVREVGNVLASSLEAKGIAVIHDKTIHDLPSYNKSYSRSLETVEAILKANPTICVIIDLHRDAASYSGNTARVFSVDGKTAAQYSLVVGEGNENATELLAFANRVNQKANTLYPGFSRGIIPKDYKYNQYINDQCLLLEMGNNQNNIEEAKLSAAYFAVALAEILKEP